MSGWRQTRDVARVRASTSPAASSQRKRTTVRYAAGAERFCTVFAYE